MSNQYLPSATSFLSAIKTKKESYWLDRGERMALKLFWEMSRRVPAYKDFLKRRKIKADQIKTIQDFKKLPTLDKDNYLRHYPLPQLCWDGNFKKTDWIIAATSGSTGEPFYFPRTIIQDKQYALLAEMYLLDNFQIHKKSTLYVNAFPLGVWIGGIFTYQAIRLVAERKQYPLSIITPGINKQEIIKSIVKLGPFFDQVIIGSYGPFLKDTLDDGAAQGINWKKYNLKFIFSAEGFTENFRDYCLRLAGCSNPYKDTLNHYGTVDLGTMAHETPLAILTRRLAVKNKKFFQALFGSITKLPTLTQYIPELFFFEENKGRLLCSAYSGLPLVRYDLKDNGGVFKLSQLITCSKTVNLNLKEKIKQACLTKTLWHLPFVYVYERSDFSVSLYAFQIYPETIRKALQKKSFQKLVTGKFTMLVKFDRKQNQFLEINIELKRGVKTTKKLYQQIQQQIHYQLIRENSEYRETFKEKGKRILPNLIFWPYENPIYFKPGIKQKWVKKD